MAQQKGRIVPFFVFDIRKLHSIFGLSGTIWSQSDLDDYGGPGKAPAVK